MARCRRPFVIAFVTTCLAVSTLYAGSALGLFGHCCPRINANETAAIATLRNIASAQRQFVAAALADEDGDGKGEYGGFRELSSSAFVRGRDRPLIPPVLSGAFRAPLHDGAVVRRSGYRFVIFLPGKDGAAAREAGPPPPPPDAPEFTGVWGPEWDRCRTTVRAAAPAVYDRAIDPDLAESVWCAYAWPDERREGSTRTFFVHGPGGVVLATEREAYEGGSGPRPGAAFAGGGLDSITGPTAAGTVGQDGSLWRVVN